jgi:predicted Zn-dependent protease
VSLNPVRSLLAQARYLSRDDSQRLAQRVLSFATADETRVTINSGSRGNTRFAVNQVSTAGDNYDATVTVRSVVGRRVGTVTTNRLEDDALRDGVRAAERLARLAPEDPELMPELPAQQYVEPRGWSEAAAALDPAGRAQGVRAIADQAKAAGLLSTGYLEVQAGATAIPTLAAFSPSPASPTSP